MSREIDILGALTIIFTVAKLWGQIDWSWWLVLLPMWGPVAIVVVIGILYVLYQLLTPIKVI